MVVILALGRCQLLPLDVVIRKKFFRKFPLVGARAIDFTTWCFSEAPAVKRCTSKGFKRELDQRISHNFHGKATFSPSPDQFGSTASR